MERIGIGVLAIVVGCVLAGCAHVGGVDPLVGQAITDAQKLQACPPFSGATLWDNGIQLTVAGEPVTDVSAGAIRNVFDAKGIPTTAHDINELVTFIGRVASKAPQFKGRTIDLTVALAEMRKTK